MKTGFFAISGKSPMKTHFPRVSGNGPKPGATRWRGVHQEDRTMTERHEDAQGANMHDISGG